MNKKNWIGRYGYTLDENTRYCSFEIHAEYKNGSFEGSVYEEEFSGFTSDLVSVKGFIEEDMISFVKTYPYFFATDETGNIIIDKSRKGHEVVYEGYFDDETGSWSGQWEILIAEERIGQGEYECLFIRGPWEMKLRMVCKVQSI